MSPNKKKSLKSGQIYRKDAKGSETDFLVYEFFLCDFKFFRYGQLCIGIAGFGIFDL